VGESSEGALAEFDALRQEILQRQGTQHQVLALQLTIAGAVFSFALTGHARSGFLLIIPLSSYMLCSRFVEDHVGIRHIGRYIRESLSPRVPGGLNWESWVARNPVTFGVPGLAWGYAYLVTYPGVALLALAAGSESFLAADHRRAPILVALALVWTLDLAITVLSAVLLWRAVIVSLSPSGSPTP
jgi:hypothetical protein